MPIERGRHDPTAVAVGVNAEDLDTARRRATSFGRTGELERIHISRVVRLYEASGKLEEAEVASELDHDTTLNSPN